MNEKLEMLIALADEIHGQVVGLFVVALLRLDDTREQRVQDARRDLVGLVEKRMEDVEDESFDAHVGFFAFKLRNI